MADVRLFALTPRAFVTKCGGLFLLLPDLVRLRVADLATAAKLPGSKLIPARHALLAALALSPYPSTSPVSFTPKQHTPG
jgi:hypothetical protein